MEKLQNYSLFDLKHVNNGISHVLTICGLLCLFSCLAHAGFTYVPHIGLYPIFYSVIVHSVRFTCRHYIYVYR